MEPIAASIDRMIEERTLLRHPFYEAWSAGEAVPRVACGLL